LWDTTPDENGNGYYHEAVPGKVFEKTEKRISGEIMKRRVFLKMLGMFFCTAGLAPEVLAKSPDLQSSWDGDDYIKDYLHKMRNFDKPYEDDICLDNNEFIILKKVLDRLTRLQQTVGYGNFYFLSFDNALSIARSYSNVGKFTKEELYFIEMLFHKDSEVYGFFGPKPVKSLTNRIKKSELVKIPNTGNYLYKGKSVELYNKIKLALGDEVILTSGVRNVIKQFKLFMSKAYRSNGNLSMASRSLAPPGYSFHGVGDFDAGQVGFGVDNFTHRFTSTSVFKKLIKLGYLEHRYHENNMLGVRFEPWHIKIT
jgi:hypothetical protein